MQYKIILGALIAVAVILVIVIAAFVIKSRKAQEDDYDEDDYDGGYDDGDNGDDELRFARGHAEEAIGNTAPVRVVQKSANVSPNRPPAKKQWKLILENLETWEKYTYVFYDNIGIGRSKNSSEFEKYLSVAEDPRVSKIHCAIIRNGDKLFLKDMGARNGTYLNGKRISQPVMIQRDYIIGICETKIEIKKVLRERD